MTSSVPDSAPASAQSCDRALAVAELLAARRDHAPLTAFSAAARPRDVADAYAIQDAVAGALGDVVAWKVGAPGPDAVPARAPILRSTLWFDAHELPADLFRMIGIEAEIVFRLSSDLRSRERPWSRDEVLAALGSVHPAFEICDTRFVEFGSQDPLSHLADQGNHGGLIVGRPSEELGDDWRGHDFAHQPVALDIDGRRVAEADGGNSAGDPIRLLVWLANEGARPFGGLKAGDTVTTGSCTGTIFIEAGSSATATFAGLGRLSLRFT